MAVKAPEAPPIDGAENPILAAIQSLVAKVEAFTGRLDAIEQKVAKHAQAVPRYRPMQHDGVNAPKADLTALKKRGDTVSVGRTLPQLADGLVVEGFRPSFQEEQIVRIRADSELAQRLAAPKRGRPFDLATEGIVLGFHIISAHDGRAKYRVHFPGLTRPRGDGFWEDELEAA